MRKNTSHRLWRAIAAATSILVLLVFCAGVAEAQACPEYDLLRNAKLVSHRGITRPERITDGAVTLEGNRYDAGEAATFSESGGFAVWDLGRVVHFEAASIQADNNDLYVISGSEDARQWQPLWEAPTAAEPGLRMRYGTRLQGQGRFVRLESPAGDPARAVTELQVFCRQPARWPPEAVVRSTFTADPNESRRIRVWSAKVVVALTAFGLLALVIPRLARERWRRAVIAAILAVSALGCWDFGTFDRGSVLHTHDSFHYFIGSKYFAELGYFDLYRCLAEAERQNGQGAAYDTFASRNLDDNLLQPGTWTRTPEGSCRGTFTPDRWREFRKDIATFHALAVRFPLFSAVLDRGYNAPPAQTAWLRAWSSWVPVTKTNLLLLAQLDTLAFTASIALIGWAFGLRAATIALVVLGTSILWGYDRMGGAFGRATWLVSFCAGVALLKRQKFFGGAFALTVSAMLRLFPLVFVGALLIRILVRAIAHRHVDEEGRKALLGVGAGAGISVVASLVVVGPAAYFAFAEKAWLHAQTIRVGKLGLVHMLAVTPGKMVADLVDPRLTDPLQVWNSAYAQAVVDRAPIWGLAVFVSAALVGWAAYRQAASWQCVLLGGLLLFCSYRVASYDYVWMIALAPFASTEIRHLGWFLGFAALTGLAGISHPELEKQHVVLNLVVFAMLVTFTVDTLRRLPQGKGAG